MQSKRILRYIKGTKNCGLLYKTEEESQLVRKIDNYQSRCIDDRISTSEYVCELGQAPRSFPGHLASNNGTIFSRSKYIAVISTACEAIQCRRILSDLHQDNKEQRPLFHENMSKIEMTMNQSFIDEPRTLRPDVTLFENWWTDRRLNYNFTEQMSTGQPVQKGYLKREVYLLQGTTWRVGSFQIKGEYQK